MNVTFAKSGHCFVTYLFFFFQAILLYNLVQSEILLIFMTNNNYNHNHNYIKILESDWSSADLISAVIGQLYASCLSNWTERVIKLALVALE